MVKTYVLLQWPFTAHVFNLIKPQTQEIQSVLVTGAQLYIKMPIGRANVCSLSLQLEVGIVLDPINALLHVKTSLLVVLN